MPSLSVTVLSSSGLKLRYQTFKQSKAEVDAGLANWESNRCIRMMPDAVGNLRPRRSGPGGPLVLQLER